MNQSPLEFSKQLIKGKIAEMIFEQMFRDSGYFTVLGFGYEKVIPELMHRQRDVESENTMELIRRAPDYAVINNDSHDVYLIEVKFRAHPQSHEILETAQRLHDSWKPAYLFLATPHGFYFGKGIEIIKENGHIKPLDHPQLPKELQEKYLGLLNQFINNSCAK